MLKNQDERKISKRSRVSSWYTSMISNGEIILQKNRLVHNKRRTRTHVILVRCMKKFIRPIIILSISLLLALTVVAFSGSSATQTSKFAEYSGAALFFQITTTPQPAEDQSEIGSTDGLTLMSFIIVTIIVVPIFLKRRNWSQP